MAVRVVLSLINQVKGDQMVFEQWARNRRSQTLSTDSALSGALTTIGRHVRTDSADPSCEVETQWSRYLNGAGSKREPFEALEATASMVVARWAMQPLPVSPSALLGSVVGASTHDALAIQLLAHVFQACGRESDLVELTTRAWASLQDLM